MGCEIKSKIQSHILWAAGYGSRPACQETHWEAGGEEIGWGPPRGGLMARHGTLSSVAGCGRSGLLRSMPNLGFHLMAAPVTLWVA
jgi:hypothetical protein